MWANRLAMGAGASRAVGVCGGSIPAAANRTPGGSGVVCTARFSTRRRQACVTDLAAKLSPSKKTRCFLSGAASIPDSQSGGAYQVSKPPRPSSFWQGRPSRSVGSGTEGVSSVSA